MFVSFLFAIIIFIITHLFAKDFIVLFAGAKMMPSIPILRLLIIIIPIVYISQYTTVLMLLVNKYDKVYFSIIFTTGVMFLVSVFLCLYFNILTVFSLVYCTLFSEIFILALSYFYVKKFDLL